MGVKFFEYILGANIDKNLANIEYKKLGTYVLNK